MTNADVTPQNRRTPVILRIILAALLLIPGAAALPVFALIAATWLIQGFQFDVSDRSLMPILLFLSEFGIAFSTVTVGIVLRYARWRKAPQASLVLAVVSLVIIAAGLPMMAGALGSVDAGDIPGLIMIAAMIAIAVSGPPFLHWRHAKKTG